MEVLPHNKTVYFSTYFKCNDCLVRTGVSHENFLYCINPDNIFNIFSFHESEVMINMIYSCFKNIYTFTKFYNIKDKNELINMATDKLSSKLISKLIENINILDILTKLVQIDELLTIIKPVKIVDIIEIIKQYLCDLTVLNTVEIKRREYIVNSICNILSLAIDTCKSNAHNDLINSFANIQVHENLELITLLCEAIQKNIIFLRASDRMPVISPFFLYDKSILILWLDNISPNNYENLGRLMPNNKIIREFNNEDVLITEIREIMNNTTTVV